MPYWINITGRTKGQKFRCSDCQGTCNCISHGNANRYKFVNICDYKFCPRCGKGMVLEQSAIVVEVEKPLEKGGRQND